MWKTWKVRSNWRRCIRHMSAGASMLLDPTCTARESSFLIFFHAFLLKISFKYCIFNFHRG